jgi:hypothetical protein
VNQFPKMCLTNAILSKTQRIFAKQVVKQFRAAEVVSKGTVAEAGAADAAQGASARSFCAESPASGMP